MVRAWSAMRAGDGLANPPRGVGGKLVAAAVLEFLHRLHQAHVAFLDQVEEREAAVGVLLRDGNDEAQIGLDHLGLRLVRLAEPLDELVMVLVEAVQRHADLLLDVLQLLLELGDVRVVLAALAARLVQLLQRALGLDQLVVVMLADDDEFLGHLLLVIEADEKFLQRGVGLDEFLLRLGQRSGMARAP